LFTLISYVNTAISSFQSIHFFKYRSDLVDDAAHCGKFSYVINTAQCVPSSNKNMLQVRNTQNIHYKKCSICTSSTYTIGHHDRKRNVYTIDPHYFVRCQGNLVRKFLQQYYIKKDCSSFIDIVMKNSLYTCAVCAMVRES